MSKIKAKQIRLASRPTGLPSKENFSIHNIEIPELAYGEICLQGLYYSVDPYMRGRMNDAKSYTSPFEIDQPIIGGVIARVTESKSPLFDLNDVVFGYLPWQEIIISNGKGLQKVDASIAPLSYYLGLFGMPGLTAYIGLVKIGKPILGETVVVSGAAGAVGMVVGQIAKILGCRVIGIAGSEEKIKKLKEEFGFDEVINYKTTTELKKVIAKLCPKAVDIYFDNVGGEISDAVIQNINFNGRIILCGQIALYNNTQVTMGPRLQPILLTRSVLMQGFIIFNYQHLFPEGLQQLSQWFAEGKLKYEETIMHGFESLPEALLGLFNGVNTGKMIVQA